ncbi:MAG TPA: hypothetical protein VL422_13320 [Miltoncostaea sp.]|nr:hypothetical protein [Miltoncostaea sp.]
MSTGADAADRFIAWVSGEPAVTVRREGGVRTVLHGEVPIATIAEGGELRMALPPDVRPAILRRYPAAEETPGGVRLLIRDDDSAAEARSLVERRIGVEAFGWQFRADGV